MVVRWNGTSTKVKSKEIADYSRPAWSALTRWLRYELFRGTLSQNAFEASERNLGNL
jgi:hypothetical protein